jgi:hypothetical protein
VFTTRPMNVSTFGLMRDNASQRTMVSSKTPQARPKALVHDLLDDDRLDDELFEDEPDILGFRFLGVRLIVNRYQAQNFQLALAVRGDYGGFVADFLVEKGTANR